jgi:CubicO group peptidase (beta-lactamase class C family)
MAPDANTIFELASVTKVFTTAILGMRVASGDLDVNALVDPYMPHRYHLLLNEQGVTFQQLATFTGGFSWDDPPGFKNGERYTQSAFIEQVNRSRRRLWVPFPTNRPCRRSTFIRTAAPVSSDKS